MARVIVVLLPLIAIAMIAVLALIIYFVIYKKRINQTIREDKPMKKPMAEPKKVAYVLLIVAGIIVILSSIKMVMFFVPSSSNISELQGRISNLEQRINDLELEIQNMHDFNDDEEMASSLVESAETTVGDYNIKTHKAAVKFKVMLKSATESTKVSISVDKKEFELKKSGSTVYEGTYDLDIFKDYSYDTYIIITDGKTSNAESGEEFMLDMLYTQCLPSISEAEIEYGSENKTSYGKYHLDVSYDIKAAEPKKVKFKSGTFKLALYKDDVLITEKNVPDVGSGETIGLNEEFDFSQGDSIYVYLFAEDTAGFIHKIKLSSWEELYRNGDASIEQDYYENGTILDKSGSTLVTYDDDD